MSTLFLPLDIRPLRAIAVRVVVTMVAVSLSPLQTRAQTTRPASAVDAMADVPARIAVREILESAPARGIPVEPLLTKVREGVAKSSTPERIHEAVRLLSDRLEAARASLAPVYSVAELTAGAGALQVGVSPASLKELRALAPAEPLTVPLGVLTEMIADGVPVRMGATQIAMLVKRRASSALLIELGARVRADVASGIAPKTALDQGSQRVLSLLAAPLTNTLQPASPPIRPPRR
jgi:hypothetical protein